MVREVSDGANLANIPLNAKPPDVYEIVLFRFRLLDIQADTVQAAFCASNCLQLHFVPVLKRGNSLNARYCEHRIGSAFVCISFISLPSWLFDKNVSPRPDAAEFKAPNYRCVREDREER